MTVFTLLISYDYSGDDLAGVYSTRALAESAYAEFCARTGCQWGDNWRVLEVVIDAPALV